MTLGEQKAQEVAAVRAPGPVDAATQSRRRRRESLSTSPDRSFLIAMAAALLALAVIIPISLKVDDTMDRKRPMYSDVEWMAWLEHTHVLDQGSARAVTVDSGQTVTLGGTRFSPSAGVSVRVTLAPHGYCVRARNQYGDVSERVCYDNDATPPDPRHQT